MTSFIVVSIISYCLINYFYQQNHIEKLEKISENYTRSYQMAYQQFNFFSRVIHTGIMQRVNLANIYEKVYAANNQEEIKQLRENLYNQVKQTRLQEKLPMQIDNLM